MLTRQKMILKEIIANYYGVHKNILAERFELSDKTVRSDVAAINSELKPYGLSILSENSVYYIPFSNKQTFIQAYNDLLEKEENFATNEYNQRKVSLLTTLTTVRSYISMSILSDKLYCSKASISQMVHDLQQEVIYLEPNAKLEISSRKGVRLLAKESVIRNLLVRYFSNGDELAYNNPNFRYYLQKDYVERIDDVIDVLTRFLNQHNIYLTEENLGKHVVHILITAYRFDCQLFVENSNEPLNPLCESLSYELSTINIKIPAKELWPLPLNRLNRNIVIDPNAKAMVQDFICKINEQYKTKILDIQDAFPLIAHVDQLLHNSGYGGALPDDFENTMLSRLLNSYIIIEQLWKDICTYVQNPIESYQRIYLAMHIQSMYRKNICIVENILLYEPNISVSGMLKIDLEKHFGKKANIVVTNSSSLIDTLMEQYNFSLIISSTTILSYFNGVPFLKIHPFLTNEDYNQIETIVYKNQEVTIQCGMSKVQEEILYQNIQVELNSSILIIRNIQLSTSINNRIPTGVYLIKNMNLYVLNYNNQDSYQYYHHMVNSFGRLVAQEKL